MHVITRLPIFSLVQRSWDSSTGKHVWGGPSGLSSTLVTLICPWCKPVDPPSRLARPLFLCQALLQASWFRLAAPDPGSSLHEFCQHRWCSGTPNYLSSLGIASTSQRTGAAASLSKLLPPPAPPDGPGLSPCYRPLETGLASLLCRWTWPWSCAKWQPFDLPLLSAPPTSLSYLCTTHALPSSCRSSHHPSL